METGPSTIAQISGVSKAVAHPFSQSSARTGCGPKRVRPGILALIAAKKKKKMELVTNINSINNRPVPISPVRHSFAISNDLHLPRLLAVSPASAEDFHRVVVCYSHSVQTILYNVWAVDHEQSTVASPVPLGEADGSSNVRCRNLFSRGCPGDGCIEHPLLPLAGPRVGPLFLFRLPCRPHTS